MDFSRWVSFSSLQSFYRKPSFPILSIGFSSVLRNDLWPRPSQWENDLSSHNDKHRQRHGTQAGPRTCNQHIDSCFKTNAACLPLLLDFAATRANIFPFFIKPIWAGFLSLATERVLTNRVLFSRLEYLTRLTPQLCPLIRVYRLLVHLSLCDPGNVLRRALWISGH